MLLLEDRRFYVYVYLDPRKPGKYEYGDYMFEAEPFYVGEGKGRRTYTSGYCKNKNTFKCKKIRKLKKDEFDPVILKYKEHLTKNEALMFEENIIKVIGRRIKKLGPLTNIYAGGHSDYILALNDSKTRLKMGMGRKNKIGTFLGKKHSEKTKRKISEANTGKKRSKKIKNKLSQIRKGRFKGKESPMFGRKHSKETIEKYKESRRGENSSMFGRKHSEKTLELYRRTRGGEKSPMFGRKHSDESKEKMRKNHKKSKPVLIDNILYYSISKASRELNESRYIILTKIKKGIPNYSFVSAVHNQQSQSLN